MKKTEILKFQKTVWDFYAQHRRELPWRVGSEKEEGDGVEVKVRREAKPRASQKVTPYQILVSEYMLQQTQVDRVVPKFTAFIQKFPDFKTLAVATDKEVLALWSGLGYNRRALYLQKTAQKMVSEYKEIIPKENTVLRTFPGIGDYMAHVLPVFVYSQREILIETNIRSVYLYHFFKTEVSVSDAQIFELMGKTTPYENVRDWYYALMDYGTYLKKEKKIKNNQSVHYAKQKAFIGSLRYVRGTLLKKLVLQKIEKSDIYDMFPEYTAIQVEKVVSDLLKETLIKETKKYFYI